MKSNVCLYRCQNLVKTQYWVFIRLVCFYSYSSLNCARELKEHRLDYRDMNVFTDIRLVGLSHQEWKLLCCSHGQQLSQ